MLAKQHPNAESLHVGEIFRLQAVSHHCLGLMHMPLQPLLPPSQLWAAGRHAASTTLHALFAPRNS